MLKGIKKGIKAGAKSTTKVNTLFKTFGVKEPKKEQTTFELKVDKLGDGKFSKNMVKMASWNLNGIRAVKRKQMFGPFFQTDDFDIVCFNETKIAEDTAKEVDIFSWFPDWYQYWGYAMKKGYSGTGILSKEKALSVQYGLGIDKHDDEGRSITLEFEKFYLFATYVPNSKSNLSRLPYRTKEWDVDCLAHINNLNKTKPTIWCGDLNVAHEEIDIFDPKGKKKCNGFTPEERERFSIMIEAGWVDSFRHLHPEEQKFSWWSHRANGRARNRGWRLDYFILSEDSHDAILEAEILTNVFGSDHCPVILEVDLDKLGKSKPLEKKKDKSETEVKKEQGGSETKKSANAKTSTEKSNK